MRYAAISGVGTGDADPRPATPGARDLDDLLLAAVTAALEQSRTRTRIRDWDAALGPGAGAERVCRSLAEMTATYVTHHTARTVLDDELHGPGSTRTPPTR